jgi:ribosome-binding protein aMBF1 (putative translation factor)
MITNERQYRITKAQLSKLKASLRGFDLKDAATRTGSVALAKAERAALESQVLDLQEQVTEYDTLRSGDVEKLEAGSLVELPTILIKARIAGGLSQRDLAEKLGVKEQQVQRDEAQNYSSAILRKLVEVADTLGLEISETAELRSSRASPRR